MYFSTRSSKTFRLVRRSGLRSFHGLSGKYRSVSGHLLSILAIVSEFFGSIGILLGLCTRLSAFGITCTLAVAGWTHKEIGFFMNWFGNQNGEGFEYHILSVSMGISLLLFGGGSWSLDSWIYDHLDS